MTSIPIAIPRFSDKNFKRLYLKKERLFINFWLYFSIVDEIYNVLETKKSILAELSPKLLHLREMFT